MKKHLAIGFGAALAVLIALIGILALRESEPVYQGRRVTYWIRDSNPFIPQSHAAAPWIQARSGESRLAMRTIGSNAVPYLIDDLQYKDSICKRARLLLRESLPQRIKRDTADWTVPDWTVRATAATILGDLGPRSQAALPYLVRALGDPFQAVQNAAIEALARIGANPDQLGNALRARLQDPMTRSQTLGYLTRFPPGGELTAQALVDVFSGRNRADQQQILYLLERIGPQAKLAVPILTSALSSANNETRYLAIRALEAVGSDAQAAVPELREKLNDASAVVTNAAARALQVIAPETKLIPPQNH